MTTESFLLSCKMCGLTHEEMEFMTIGMCLDFMDEYVEVHNPKKKTKVKKASQEDFDSF